MPRARAEGVVSPELAGSAQAAGGLAVAAANKTASPERAATYRDQEAMDLYLANLYTLAREYPILTREQEAGLAKRIEAGWAAEIILAAAGATEDDSHEAWQDLKESYDNAQRSNDLARANALKKEKKQQAKQSQNGDGKEVQKKAPHELPREIDVPAELGRWAMLIDAVALAHEESGEADGHTLQQDAAQPSLSDIDLLHELVKDGKLAEDTFRKSNLRLVVPIAQKYLSSGWPIGDLVHEGNLGMMHAVKKFDFSKGYKFSTYATIWINQHIARALANKARSIRIPVATVDRIRTIHKATRNLEAVQGDKPVTTADIAKATKLSVTAVKETLATDADTKVDSIDAYLTDETDTTFADRIADTDNLDPAVIVVLRMGVEQLHRMVDALPPREAMVVRMRFGLDDGRQHTLEEVGKAVGMTPQGIRQLEKRVIDRLRGYARSHGVTDDLLEVG